MSRKTSIPRKTILGDHGTQTYRSCGKGFAEAMRAVTFKRATDETSSAIIIRESEFAKPYGEQYEDPTEDFSEMEYPAPSYPPWGTDFPGMADLEEYYSPWKIVFFCDHGWKICWCSEEAMSFYAKCTFEIIKAEFNPPWNDVGVSWGKNTIYTYGLADAKGCGDLTITMKASFKVGVKTETVIGIHSGIKVCECDEEECAGCSGENMSWDYGLSPETIAQNTSVSVFVDDSNKKGAPYTWSVAEPCFNLDEAITDGLENTLNADADACGPATITVTACDNIEITAVVRCTNGEWNNIYGGCGLTAAQKGPFTSILGYGDFERIVDEVRQTQTFLPCLGDPEQCCETGCGTVMNPCASVGGPCSQDFTECLDWTDEMCDNMLADTNECGYFKCSWPFGACNEKPGCICHHQVDIDYYEWECPGAETCT